MLIGWGRPWGRNELLPRRRVRGAAADGLLALFERECGGSWTALSEAESDEPVSHDEAGVPLTDPAVDLPHDRSGARGQRGQVVARLVDLRDDLDEHEVVLQIDVEVQRARHRGIREIESEVESEERDEQVAPTTVRERAKPRHHRGKIV